MCLSLNRLEKRNIQRLVFFPFDLNLLSNAYVLRCDAGDVGKNPWTLIHINPSHNVRYEVAKERMVALTDNAKGVDAAGAG